MVAPPLSDLQTDEDGLLPSLQEIRVGQTVPLGRDGGEASPGTDGREEDHTPCRRWCGDMEEAQGNVALSVDHSPSHFICQ